MSSALPSHTLTVAGSPNLSSAQKEVIAAHEAYIVATRQGDAAALQQLFGEELLYSHSNALLEDKATAIANIVSGTPDFDLHEQSVTVYGDVATIRAKATSRKGPLLLTILIVWVKRNGQWQMVQRHTTRVPE